MNAAYVPEWFESSLLPVRERAETFARSFTRTMTGMQVEVREPESCAARMVMVALPGARLVSCFHPRARFSASGHADGDARAHDVILLRPVGEALSVHQRGREIRLGPGEATLISLAHEVAFDAFTHDRIDHLRMPAAAILSAGVDLDDVLLRVASAEHNTLRLLAHYAGAVMQGMIPLPSERHARLAANHMRDLAGVIFGPADSASLMAATGRIAAIKEQIARKLGSRDLSIETIARSNGITPRYVQMLFEAEGTTFTSFVLDQRLERARLGLNRVGGAGEADRSISSIAFEAGFGDLSYFNRTFRRRFGVSPSQFRKQASEAG